MSRAGDDDVDDEDRLAAVLVVLALTRDERVTTGGLARWRARRLACLQGERGGVRPAGPGARGGGT
jgi:hypothetical protein